MARTIPITRTGEVAGDYGTDRDVLRAIAAAVFGTDPSGISRVQITQPAPRDQGVGERIGASDLVSAVEMLANRASALELTVSTLDARITALGG